jgi:hypothetical protein
LPVQVSFIVALPLLVTVIAVPSSDTLPVAGVVVVVLPADGVFDPDPLLPPVVEPPPVPPLGEPPPDASLAVIACS